MRSTVIISKRGQGYIAQVSGPFGGGFHGVRCGLTPEQAAARAAGWMCDYAQTNKEGGDLMAPSEVMELVPVHLRSVPKRD
jgi:hypothetical protein